MSPLEICKILRLFLTLLTADDKYSLVNRDILTQPIQMHLSQKEIFFFECSSTFSKFTSNVEQLKQKSPS